MSREQLTNSLTDLTGRVADGVINQLNKFQTLERNVKHQMISQNRALLSDLYVDHGIVQTLVDQPVDDAFSKGFESKHEAPNPEIEVPEPEKKNISNHML